MNRLIYTLLVAGALLQAFPNGTSVPTGNAGEPGTGTPCAACHTVTLNPSSGSVRLSLPTGNVFAVGAVQRMTVTVTDANPGYAKGFQLTASGGTFAAVSGTAVVMSGSGKQYVTHTGSAVTYSFDWTPPATGDTVTMYLAGVAASGTRLTDVYTSTAVLTLSTVGPVTSKPAINTAGVVSAASFAPGMSRGSWISIFGTNLAPSGVARTWVASEIVNGKLPTTIENTQVNINGKPAAIAYVSPSQLNVQVPDDASLGQVAVQVITATGTSDTIFADLRISNPGVFRFTPSGSRYAAAVHADGTLSGPAGLFGENVTVRAARPGDVLQVFGTGLGPTNPLVTPGFVFTGAAPLAEGNSLLVRVGGIPVQVNFAGLSATGLYQINLVVPVLTDGDYVLEVSAFGQSVPTQQYIAVKN